MNTKYRHVQRARASAAASIEWPANTPFLVNPDPAVRMKLRRGFFAVSALLFVCLLCTAPSGPIAESIKLHETNTLRPTMELAFAHGNKAAGTWLWQHYPKEYPGLLEQEANAGEPIAMYLTG